MVHCFRLKKKAWFLHICLCLFDLALTYFGINIYIAAQDQQPCSVKAHQEEVESQELLYFSSVTKLHVLVVLTLTSAIICTKLNCKKNTADRLYSPVAEFIVKYTYPILNTHLPPIYSSLSSLCFLCLLTSTERSSSVEEHTLVCAAYCSRLRHLRKT